MATGRVTTSGDDGCCMSHCTTHLLRKGTARRYHSGSRSALESRSRKTHRETAPAVAVVHQKVGPQRRCRVVVDAAGAKSDVTHDEGLLHPSKPAMCARQSSASPTKTTCTTLAHLPAPQARPLLPQQYISSWCRMPRDQHPCRMPHDQPRAQPFSSIPSWQPASLPHPPFQDVSNHASIEQQALGELQRHPLGPCLAQPPHLWCTGGWRAGGRGLSARSAHDTAPHRSTASRGPPCGLSWVFLHAFCRCAGELLLPLSTPPQQSLTVLCISKL